MKLLTVCCTLALIGTAVLLEAQSARPLTAPTFYIAARAANELLSYVEVYGATNLPPGAKLTVAVSDFIGEGGDELTEQMFPIVGPEGLFKVTLYPKSGKHFMKGSMVCSIAFLPTYPLQSESVLKVVGGTHGTALGDARNPQIGVSSGDHWYLRDLVYIPPVPSSP